MRGSGFRNPEHLGVLTSHDCASNFKILETMLRQFNLVLGVIKLQV